MIACSVEADPRSLRPQIDTVKKCLEEINDRPKSAASGCQLQQRIAFQVVQESFDLSKSVLPGDVISDAFQEREEIR
jgi:hypothetical protein